MGSGFPQKKERQTSNARYTVPAKQSKLFSEGKRRKGCDFSVHFWGAESTVAPWF